MAEGQVGRYTSGSQNDTGRSPLGPVERREEPHDEGVVSRYKRIEMQIVLNQVVVDYHLYYHTTTTFFCRKMSSNQ